MRLTTKNRKLECGLEAYAKSVRGNRSLANLRERLANWPMYAAAAGSALALSSSAAADIIHPASFPGLAVPGSNGAATARTMIGSAQFVLRGAYHFTGFPPSPTYPFGFDHASGRFSVSMDRGSLLGGALKSGDPIRPSAFSPNGFLLLRSVNEILTSNPIRGWESHIAARHTGGSWGSRIIGPPVTAFAGFRLPNGDPGWLKIQVICNPYDGVPIGAGIMDWAYATNGESITAGETQSPVPEPSSLSLSLLAMGSAAVLAWRRLRKQRSQPSQ